jgi:hypothetical protein
MHDTGYWMLVGAEREYRSLITDHLLPITGYWLEQSVLTGRDLTTFHPLLRFYRDLRKILDKFLQVGYIRYFIN